MKLLMFALFAGFLSLSITSCAHKDEDTTREGREKISTVPWSKPESWEGKGALGGIVQ